MSHDRDVTRSAPIVLAVVLLCAPAGCSRTATDVPLDGAAQAPSNAAASADLPESARALLALLPADGAVSGWSRKPDVGHYGTNSLWDYINGGADTYLACGFKEVVTSEYSNPAVSSAVLVDLYHMSDARAAFGIYSQERSPTYDFRRIGAEGYLAGSAVNFWAGPYYVKLTAFKESDEVRREMTKLAEAISGSLGDPGRPPAEADAFPPEGLQPHSVRYVPRNVLGQEFLTGGFEARYRSGESEHTLVIVGFAGDGEAASALTRYREALAASAGDVRQLARVGDGGFSSTEPSLGTIVAVQAGRRLVVAAGVPSVDAGLALIRALLARR